MSRLVCATTVVSAPRADDIARAWGCQLRRTLTGRKFIGEQIGLLGAAGEGDRFLFVLEESCGYLKGSYVRDKDGVEALALVCEMAADYRMRSMDLVDALGDLARHVGFQSGEQLTVPSDGADGSARMAGLMASLRAEAPGAVAGLAVEAVVDYSDGASMPVVNSLPGDPGGLPPTDIRALAQLSLHLSVRHPLHPARIEYHALRLVQCLAHVLVAHAPPNLVLVLYKVFGLYASRGSGALGRHCCFACVHQSRARGNLPGESQCWSV